MVSQVRSGISVPWWMFLLGAVLLVVPFLVVFFSVPSSVVEQKARSADVVEVDQVNADLEKVTKEAESLRQTLQADVENPTVGVSSDSE